MKITDARKRLKAAVKKLNELQEALVFEVEETEYSIGFTNHGRQNVTSSYGCYEYAALFDDFKKKSDAYITAMWVAEMLVSACRMYDPKAYHNICELGTLEGGKWDITHGRMHV